MVIKWKGAEVLRIMFWILKTKRCQGKQYFYGVLCKEEGCKMKIIKKRMSILKCVVMMLGLLILPSNVEAAGVKTKISAKKITLKVGQKKHLQ